MGFKDIFKKFKKNDIVVDLGDLQKRGIVKQPIESNDRNSGRSGVMDLTSGSDTSSSGGSDSALGFLGALAGTASTDTNNTSNTERIEPATTNSLINRRTRVRGILRDIKLDMKNTTDRIYKLTDRLDLLEKKIERLERRAGLE